MSATTRDTYVEQTTNSILSTFDANLTSVRLSRFMGNARFDAALPALVDAVNDAEFQLALIGAFARGDR